MRSATEMMGSTRLLKDRPIMTEAVRIDSPMTRGNHLTVALSDSIEPTAAPVKYRL